MHKCITMPAHRVSLTEMIFDRTQCTHSQPDWVHDVEPDGLCLNQEQREAKAKNINRVYNASKMRQQKIEENRHDG